MRANGVLFLLFLFAASLRADTFLVLPFFNQTDSTNLNWIGESVAETVREAAASESLVAIDREDREEAYRRLSLRPYAVLTKASVIKLGQALDANRVLYGWFELTPPPANAPAGTPKTRGTLKLVGRFLDLRRLSEGREFSETGALEDLASLQSHLAWQALQLLAPASAPSEAEFRKRHPSIRVDALESYIRGLLNPSLPEKYKLFNQAVQLSPGFSQPSFELGRLAWKNREYKTASEWLVKVSPSDPHYHEANFLLGLSRFQLADYTGAEKAFQMVAAAVPLSEVFNNLGAAQSRRNLPAALDNFKKALSQDQSDPVYYFNVGYALWKQGDFPGALENFQSLLARDPQDAEAPVFIERCRRRSGPQPGDTQTEGRERLKTNFEENAYLQLKDIFRSKGK